MVLNKCVMNLAFFVLLVTESNNIVIKTACQISFFGRAETEELQVWLFSNASTGCDG